MHINIELTSDKVWHSEIKRMKLEAGFDQKDFPFLDTLCILHMESIIICLQMLLIESLKLDFD